MHGIWSICDIAGYLNRPVRSETRAAFRHHVEEESEEK